MGDCTQSIAAELEDKSSGMVLIIVVPLDVWIVRLIFSPTGSTMDLRGIWGSTVSETLSSPAMTVRGEASKMLPALVKTLDRGDAKFSGGGLVCAHVTVR